MASDHTIAIMSMDTTVAFDNIVAFVIPAVDLLTIMLVTWREEHIWNITVQLSKLVRYSLRFSEGEEHLMGPSMSLVFFNRLLGIRKPPE
jgi:hypothetical protein